jgi:hypothetical protein
MAVFRKKTNKQNKHHKRNVTKKRQHKNKLSTMKKQKRRNGKPHRGGTVKPMPFQTYSSGNPQQESLNTIHKMNQHQHSLIHGLHGQKQSGGAQLVPQFQSPGGFGFKSPVNPNTLSQKGNSSMLQGSENSKYDSAVNQVKSPSRGGKRKVKN